MVVRIRWQKWHEAHPSRYEKAALATASLLTPSALLAFTMAFWIVASDLRWTRDSFPAGGGVLSHWQIWLAAAGVLLLIARLLDRYATRKADYS